MLHDFLLIPAIADASNLVTGHGQVIRVGFADSEVAKSAFKTRPNKIYKYSSTTTTKHHHVGVSSSVPIPRCSRDRYD